jgi:putative transposase
MPWRESCAIGERLRFIVEHRSSEWTMTELCERFEIGRKTGYKWLERRRVARPCDAGAPGGGDRRPAARTSDLGTAQDPSTSFRSASRRRIGRRRRRRARSSSARVWLGELTVPQYANPVWSVDHKGWARLGDGSRVEPLTMTDGFSRYPISLSTTASTAQNEAKPLFEKAFRECVLPRRSAPTMARPSPRREPLVSRRCRPGGSNWAFGTSASILAIPGRTAGTNASI